MFIFGSTLVKKLFPDFREPKDKDWVVFDKSQVSLTVPGVEEFYYLPCSPAREMTADEIYTVKVSHAIRDIHWSKTMTDIRFLQRKGCKLIPGFLQELRAYWDEYHGVQRRTNFDIAPEKFFNDKVKRVVPHDQLHVMLKDPPTYVKILHTGKVEPSEGLFQSLTPEEQVSVAFEEAFVIALERFGHREGLNAYHLAQMALVTRIHPVWIADFVINNWNLWFWTATSHQQLNQRFRELRRTLNNHDNNTGI